MDRVYWFVGSNIDGVDETERFLREGIWEHGYTEDSENEEYVELVNSRMEEMNIGDKIAIKSTYTQKNGLPFNNKGQFVSVMKIKATGSIVEKINDRVKVKWDGSEELTDKYWYFFTDRSTIWKVEKDEDWKNNALIDFTFNSRPQDIDRFRNDPYWIEKYGTFDAIFDWIPFYEELAIKLLDYEDNREELAKIVSNSFININMKNPMEKKIDGKLEMEEDICPFTVFSVINRGITEENKYKALKEYKKYFNIESKVPESTIGIPRSNNMSVWFYGDRISRKEGDIDNLWALFKTAQKMKDGSDIKLDDEFIRLFDEIKDQLSIGIRKLTMGLFWTTPYIFIPLDGNTQELLIKDFKGIDQEFLNNIDGKEYLELIRDIKRIIDEENYSYKSIPELSQRAWLDLDDKKDWELVNIIADILRSGEKSLKEIYELVYDSEYDLTGYEHPDSIIRSTIYEHSSDTDKYDQSNEDLFTRVGEGRTGIWKLRENENIIRENNMDYKSISEQRLEEIIAVLKEYGGQASLKQINDRIEERGRIDTETNKNWRSSISQIIQIHSSDTDSYKSMEIKKPDLFKSVDGIGQGIWALRESKKYDKSDFLNEVFISEEEYETIVSLLDRKRNLILQGPPGVGKTFMAKRLAYSIIGEKNEDRLEMVQFHQNYSYEDFVMGYRPSKDNFQLRKGVFYKFCEKARLDKENRYYFIIDEINRGNLSRIFGELMMLIEDDKRGEEITLAYSDERFSVPENLYIIGMMNTADRSLAMIDYALRRRFVFYDLKPAFNNDKFIKSLSEKLSNQMIERINTRISRLNHKIKEDINLGDGFKIGHSYFCGYDTNIHEDKWYEEVIKYEIEPLLREYWFDDMEQVDRLKDELLGD